MLVDFLRAKLNGKWPKKRNISEAEIFHRERFPSGKIYDFLAAEKDISICWQLFCGQNKSRKSTLNKNGNNRIYFLVLYVSFILNWIISTARH